VKGMKTLLITPEFPPAVIGGGGIVYQNLSEHLALKDNKVTVIAGNISNKGLWGKVKKPKADNVVVNLIPLFPFPKNNNYVSSSYTFPTLSGSIHLLKELIKSKDTAIHLHGFCHPMIDMAAFFCLFFDRKYVLTCHGIPKSPETSSLKGLFKLYLSTIESIVVRNAAALTVVSNALLNECKTKNLVNDNMTVIPNGPNNALVEVTAKTASEVEKKYSLENKKVIFAIGRMSPVKGFQFLVAAMQKVALILPDVVAVIAGSGPFLTTLIESVNETGLSDNVKLVGQISEQKKAALYQRSEAVVFPSLNEPFGIVILEALRMHKPIIAFNTESSREVIKKGTGLLVPAGDSAELANAIVKIVTDLPLRQRIIANTMKDEIVSWEKIADSYIGEYHKLKKEGNKITSNRLIDNKVRPFEIFF
jgi:1,4-alpha-glucan branching enzyme